MSTDAPGLKRRTRADGTIAYYWVATAVSRKATGYTLKTMRLEGDEVAAAARCRVLTAELREWLAGNAVVEFDGTIASLIDIYKSDEDSPYVGVKANTRHHYDDTLKIIRHDVGKAVVDDLTRKHFAKWYRKWRTPLVEGGAERVRRAHNCIKLLRIIFRFGASMKFTGCAAARDVLADMEFELPAPRRECLDYHQAEAIIDRALIEGRFSMALAQALQFECSLRQRDVIGEWTKDAVPGQQGIVAGGWRWANGVVWSDVSPDLWLTKQTTKTAAKGEWHLSQMALVSKVLIVFQHVVGANLIGPMIVSETTGLPYREGDYRVKWRALADSVGVPRDIWNMDSRAGGITEADGAGAEIRDIQRHATHATAQSTNRYVRGTRQATSKVADLRAASRVKGRTE